jgi:hypothetical protein
VLRALGIDEQQIATLLSESVAIQASFSIA